MARLENDFVDGHVGLRAAAGLPGETQEREVAVEFSFDDFIGAREMREHFSCESCRDPD